MSTVLTLLTMISSLLPQLSALSSGAIGTVIGALLQIMPTVVSEVEGVAPFIKNIIAALSSSTNVTPDQLAQLQVLDAQCDAAFESAATEAGV